MDRRNLKGKSDLGGALVLTAFHEIGYRYGGLHQKS